MDIRNRLDHEFSSQHTHDEDNSDVLLKKYIKVAEGYADIEHVVAVLSDLKNHSSHIFYGRFAQLVSLDCMKCGGKVPSIWEQVILDAISPDDLELKMLHELLFFHYIRTLPKRKRFDVSLYQRLRMRSRSGGYVDVLHRLYYIPDKEGSSVRFALCLYGPLPPAFSGDVMVVDNTTGAVDGLGKSSGSKILSKQEIAVLRQIDSGQKSKEIAETLNISVHTVSRHRQNIIAKLQVNNSVEACKVARTLGILL